MTAPIGASATERWRTSSGTWFCVWTYVASRALTVVAAAGIASIAGTSLDRILSRWDGGWYLSIAAYGYPSFVPGGAGPAAQSSLAFFPGYPILVQAFSLPGVHPVFAGCALSLAAGLGATIGVRELAARLTDDRAADRAAVLFAFLPAAFVLSMVYADALFLFLAAWCLIALFDGRWWAAGGASAAAGLVRPTAIALVVACAWAANVSIRGGGSRRALVAPALAPVGMLLFLGYLWIRTGHALAFFEVQSRGWGNRFDLGASNLGAVLRHVADGRVTFFVAMLAIVGAGVAVGLLLLVRWRAPGFLVAYVSVVLALAIMGSNPLSVPRFLLAAFPILIPIADHSSPRATPILTAASAVVMTTLFFVTGLSPTLPP